MVRILPCYFHVSYWWGYVFQHFLDLLKSYCGEYMYSYRVWGCYITMQFSHKLLEVCFSPKRNLSLSKSPQCSYVSYRVCDAYITVPYSHELTEYVFQQLFSSAQKVTIVFVCKLLGMWFVYYCAMFT